MKLAEKLDYLFSKINFNASYLDEKAIEIMEDIRGEVAELEDAQSAAKDAQKNPVKTTTENAPAPPAAKKTAAKPSASEKLLGKKK